MRHIVIEGPDGAGKTTLATALANRALSQGSHFKYEHAGPPRLRVPPFYQYGAKLFSKLPHIYDRLHLGEVVYPRVLGNRNPLDDYQLRLLRRLINGRGSKVILVLPPFEVCCDRWAERRQQGQELLETESLLRDSYMVFRDLEDQADVTLLHSMLYNEEQLDGLLRERKACPAGVIGSPYARVLLVGERPARNAALDTSFFADTLSSRYLNDALTEAPLPESDLAFVNAFNRAGEAHDLPRTIQELLNLQVVVCLGQVAGREFARAVPKLGTAHASLGVRLIEHPAYWRRFKARQRDRYVDYFREIREMLTWEETPCQKIS